MSNPLDYVNPLAQQLSAIFPLITSLSSPYSVGDGTPTFTRNLAGSYLIDFEGRYIAVPANCARFMGDRVVQNLVASSENLTSGWTTNQATVAYGATAYDGTATANAFTETTGSSWHGVNHTAKILVAGATQIIAFDLKAGTRTWAFVRVTGLDKYAYINLATGTVGTVSLNSAAVKSLGNGWYRFYVWATPSSSTNDLLVSATTGDGVASYTANNGDVAFYAGRVQVENVTGQTNQNPSEYVSVGVLPSAPYHGANVDGVKYFDTLPANTVTSNVVTEATGAKISGATAKWGSLPGVNGSYFSTPDSAANSITGDIDIRVNVSMNNWSTLTNLVHKAVSAGQYSYWFQVTAAAKLTLNISVDGTAISSPLSSAAMSYANGTSHWVRVTRASSTGNTNFYTSEDGVNWTLLGTANQASTTGSIFDSTSEVGIGASSGGGTNSILNGRIYRAQIYNGIGGTLAVDFNPCDSTTAQTWTSATTGETWTTNGNARVYGNTNATYGIPAWFNETRPLGLLVEGARTNLALQSNAFTTAPWAAASAATGTAGTGITAPDGTATAFKIVETTAAGQFGYIQAITIASGGASVKIHVKAAERTRLGVGVIADTLKSAIFDLSAVTATGTMAAPFATHADSSAIKALPNGWYECTLYSSAANVSRVDLYALDSGTDRSYTGTAGNGINIWQVDVVNASTASTPITTVAASVQRPADVLKYALAGNISNTAGTAYAEVANTFTAAAFPTNGVNSDHTIIGDTAGTGVPLLGQNPALLRSYDGAYRTIGALAPTTSVSKVASAWSGTVLTGAVNGTTATGVFDGDMGMATTMEIGSYSGVQQWNGCIANVRIWTRALPAATLAQLTL